MPVGGLERPELLRPVAGEERRIGMIAHDPVLRNPGLPLPRIVRQIALRRLRMIRAADQQRLGGFVHLRCVSEGGIG